MDMQGYPLVAARVRVGSNGTVFGLVIAWVLRGRGLYLPLVLWGGDEHPRQMQSQLVVGYGRDRDEASADLRSKIPGAELDLRKD